MKRGRPINSSGMLIRSVEQIVARAGNAGKGLLMYDEQLNHLMAIPVDLTKRADQLEPSRLVSSIWRCARCC